MYKPHKEVCYTVCHLIAMSAEHKHCKAKNSTEYDGRKSDEDCDACTLYKQLPSVFSYKCLVEAIFEALEESNLTCIFAQYNKSDWCCVIYIGESTCLVSLFTYYNVHSKIILTCFDSRSNRFERNFEELWSITISTTETTYKVNVITCKMSVTNKGERLISPLYCN